MRKILLLFLMVSYLSLPVYASPSQVYAHINYATDHINLSLYAPNQNSKIMLETPSGVFLESGQTYIDRIMIFCSNYVGLPTGTLNIRFYWRDDQTLFSNGDWQYIGSHYYNVPASACNDYGAGLSIYTDDRIYITGSYLGFDHALPIGVGISVTNSDGVGLLYDDNTHLFVKPNGSVYSPQILYLNRTNVLSGATNVSYVPYILYGDTTTPPTVTPTPHEPDYVPGPSDPLPCTDCNTSLPSDTGGNGSFDPDFGNASTYCPTCLGNETNLGYGTISTQSGFCSSIISFGYGSNDGCTSADFIDFFYDWSEYAFYVSFMIIILKIVIIRKANNPNPKQRGF